MESDEKIRYVKSSQALDICREFNLHITHATLLTWVMKYELGFQPNGKNSHFLINEIKLRRFLTNGAK